MTGLLRPCAGPGCCSAPTSRAPGFLPRRPCSRPVRRLPSGSTPPRRRLPGPASSGSAHSPGLLRPAPCAPPQPDPLRVRPLGRHGPASASSPPQPLPRAPLRRSSRPCAPALPVSRGRPMAGPRASPRRSPRGWLPISRPRPSPPRAAPAASPAGCSAPAPGRARCTRPRVRPPPACLPHPLVALDALDDATCRPAPLSLFPVRIPSSTALSLTARAPPSPPLAVSAPTSSIASQAPLHTTSTNT